MLFSTPDRNILTTPCKVGTCIPDAQCNASIPESSLGITIFGWKFKYHHKTLCQTIIYLANPDKLKLFEKKPLILPGC